MRDKDAWLQSVATEGGVTQLREKKEKMNKKKRRKNRKDRPTRVSKLFMCGAFTARFKSDVGNVV